MEKQPINYSVQAFLQERGVKMINSTQSNVLYSNEIFKQYLMQLSSGIVWKNSSRAIDNESTDLVDLYQTELFVVANRGLLNFDIVKAFPRSVLLNSAVTEIDLESYATDKRKIPVALRKTVVAEYEKALTSVNPISGRPGYFNTLTGKYETIYEENNNYYRMLMGLPDKNDNDYIYNTDPRWSTTIPIHELPYVDRIEMEREGILDKLIEKYPSKEYINYLGKRYINPFTARIADRFEILYHNESSSDVLNKDFIDSYNSARHLVLSVYYNNSFRKTNTLYDNFLAMCILFIALQGMQYKYLQVDITRDFYDTESLKLVYDSYGVPFYNEIPLEYHRKIVKNINKLISYKGSSQVFFDLFDIFDLGAMNIYSYFLTKTHIIDTNGIPLFNIKKDADGNEMYDDEGRPILDESNYNIQFSRVKIYDDPALAVSDETNNVEYESLTENDPYWIEDAELATKLAGENFNYLESKYIGIQTVFDLMKMTYENAYIFRLIIDNKELTSKMQFRWSEIGDTCTLFDIIIYLSAIYCLRFGYEGVISNKIPAIMDTLGYNFEKSRKVLQTRLLTDPIILENKQLTSLILDMDLVNLESVNDVYNDIVQIRDILIDGYTNAKNIDEYNAYRELYNSLMVSREITSVYTNPSTGEIYDTFVDILSNTSPILMQRYLLLNDSDLENEIILVTDHLASLIESLKYLSLSMGIGTGSMIEPLFKILKFFKSAKAELVNYNITYTISMRGLNFFKMLDKLMMIMNDLKISEDTYIVDIMNLIYTAIKHKRDIIQLTEETSDLRTKVYLKKYVHEITDMIMEVSAILDYIFKDEVWYIDFIHKIQTKINIASHLILDDISNTTLVSLDILEAKYKGLINDSIRTLTDYLIENPSTPNLHFFIEIVNSIDLIHLLINESKDPTLRSEGVFIDNINQKINSDIDESLSTSDKLVSDSITLKYEELSSDIKEYLKLIKNYTSKNDAGAVTDDFTIMTNSNTYITEYLSTSDNQIYFESSSKYEELSSDIKEYLKLVKSYMSRNDAGTMTDDFTIMSNSNNYITEYLDESDNLIPLDTSSLSDDVSFNIEGHLELIDNHLSKNDVGTLSDSILSTEHDIFEESLFSTDNLDHSDTSSLCYDKSFNIDDYVQLIKNYIIKNDDTTLFDIIMLSSYGDIIDEPLVASDYLFEHDADGNMKLVV